MPGVRCEKFFIFLDALWHHLQGVTLGQRSLTTTLHALHVKSATTDNAADCLRRGSLLKLLSVELESLEKRDCRDSSRRESSGELASDQSSLRRN